LRPDGRLGGHGYPDPKYIIVAGVRYAAKTPPNNLIERILFYFLEWLGGIRYKLFG